MPVLKSASPETELAVQKAWLDQLWVTTATQRLDAIRNAEPSTKAFSGTTDELNRGKSEHLRENKSFKQLFLAELRGALDFYKLSLGDIMIRIKEQDTGLDARKNETAKQECGQMVANLIHEAFRRNKLNRELPSLWLRAGLHAAVHWDRARKYKANDLWDFRHAVAAIPYFDYFLTERSLRALLSDRNLRLETLFPCKAFSDASLAAESLAPICK